MKYLGGGGQKEICRESRGRVVIPELESCIPIQEVLNKLISSRHGFLVCFTATNYFFTEDFNSK